MSAAAKVLVQGAMAYNGVDEGGIGSRGLRRFPEDCACPFAPPDRPESDLAMREVFAVERHAECIKHTTFRHLKDRRWEVLIRKTGQEPAKLPGKPALRRLHVSPSCCRQYSRLMRKSRAGPG